MRFGKRILSVLLTVCMMLTLLPAAVAADAPAHVHCICGGTTDIGDHTSHEAVTFTAWPQKDTDTPLPTAAGYYYLTEDVAFVKNDEGWNFNADIVLCLNGHNITNTGGKRAVKVETETFTLCDCAETDGVLCSRNDNSATGTDGSVEVKKDGTFHMYGGSLSGNYSTEWKGGGVDNQGTFHMYGGTISNNTMNYGAGVINRSDSASKPVFNMYGGTISGNTSTGNGKDKPDGAGVICMDGTEFNMYGGTISNNTALRGSGVYLRPSASFTMYGGEISGNKWTEEVSENSGGGIYALEGTITIKGGTISNNSAYQDGGGIYATNNNAEITIEGGTISGNTAKYGAGVYAGHASSLTVSGGEILNNVSTDRGGGIFIHSDVTSASLKNLVVTGNTASTCGGGVYNEYKNLSISGKMIVTANTSTERNIADNLFMGTPDNTTNHSTVIIDALEDGASVGVTVDLSRDHPLRFSTGGKDFAEYFTSDDPAYVVRPEGENLTLFESATVTFVSAGGTFGSVRIGRGETISALPTPVRDGYTFDGWYDADGRRITDTYVFTANTTLYARWTKDKTLDLGAWYGAVRMLYGQKFTVEATAAPGGAVTPEGISEVLYDRSVTYRITPDEGYRVVSVLVDGEDMGALEKYTFKHVREDHTISVIFEEIE